MSDEAIKFLRHFVGRHSMSQVYEVMEPNKSFPFPESSAYRDRGQIDRLFNEVYRHVEDAYKSLTTTTIFDRDSER